MTLYARLMLLLTVAGVSGWRRLRILGVSWFDLPLEVRRMWWRETKYSHRRPSSEFMARLPQLLSDATLEVENEKRERAAELAAGRTLLSRALPPPCEDCLRPASPCRERCLRSILE